MLRIVLLRGTLVAAPFVAWFVWRAIARRQGHAMGSTPWAWLLGAGALLAGLSLAASALLQPDNRDKVYVPGKTLANGEVTQGRFEEAPER